MTTLREVVAEELIRAGAAKWSEDAVVKAAAVLSAIFAPENREALREELVGRGALEPIMLGVGLDREGRLLKVALREQLWRFPPDSSAGSGGAG